MIIFLGVFPCVPFSLQFIHHFSTSSFACVYMLAQLFFLVVFFCFFLSFIFARIAVILEWTRFTLNIYHLQQFLLYDNHHHCNSFVAVFVVLVFIHFFLMHDCYHFYTVISFAFMVLTFTNTICESFLFHQIGAFHGSAIFLINGLSFRIGWSSVTIKWVQMATDFSTAFTSFNIQTLSTPNEYTFSEYYRNDRYLGFHGSLQFVCSNNILLRA